MTAQTFNNNDNLECGMDVKNTKNSEDRFNDTYLIVGTICYFLVHILFQLMIVEGSFCERW